MAELSTTVALGVLLCFDLGCRVVLVQILVFVVLRLVLAEFAAFILLVLLATAPPHLPTPIANVLCAAPIEILLFIIIFATIFARFKSTVELAFPADQLGDPCLHFATLIQ